uniref:Uncharacterized protein n=1 Tax=Panagrolaimus sp. PS1159 TaxID=55785 RepID=A0AC35FS60_9BILA
MPVIKEQIERILNGYINTTNVVKLANKSLEYNAPILKGYCFTYISKCIEDGKQYDEASNLHQEIIDELYKSSVFRTVMS